jgi:hypothetical protein
MVYSMLSKRKPKTGHIIIEKAKYFYDEMEITDKCTCLEGSNKKLPLRT